ncbi:hypothetical protein GCM10020331_032010 [Ectobacillus funiculus]
MREFDFGMVKLTQAFHGSAYIDEQTKTITYTGMPAGILFTAEGKKRFITQEIQRCFSDMKLLGSRHSIDVAFFCRLVIIFTMGPEDAALAAQWLGAKVVVPMHYNTFPPIQQDPHHFVEMLQGSVGKVLQPGEAIEL